MPTKTQQPLVDGTGRRLQTGRLLGKGGEGAVYDLVGVPGVVAKLYHQPLSPERASKIRMMAKMSSPDLDRLCAWPRELLLHGTQPRGFLMPHVVGRKELHMLHGPKSRKTEFPDAGFDFLVHVALNIARAFAQLHAMGVIVGDVNDRGFLVGGDGTVRVIDCDSFQISGHACGVGVPEYTPPELQGLSLSGVARTENHDAFGLAVLIFRLLFMGRHPFAGRFEGGHKEIHEAIREDRYAYARDIARTRMRPPPNMLGVAEGAGSRIADLFEQAFAAGSRGGKTQRPMARDWVAALEGLKKELAVCRFNAAHAFARARAACPWCELEQRYGVDFFHFVPAGGATAQSIDVEAIWEVIGALSAPAVPRPLHEQAIRVQKADVPSRLKTLREEAESYAAEARRARTEAGQRRKVAENRQLEAHDLLAELASGHSEVAYLEARLRRLEAGEPRYPTRFAFNALTILVLAGATIYQSLYLLLLGAASFGAIAGSDALVARVRAWSATRLGRRLHAMRQAVVAEDPELQALLDDAARSAEEVKTEASRTEKVACGLEEVAAQASSEYESEVRKEIHARDQRLKAAEQRASSAQAVLSGLSREATSLQSVIDERRRRLSGSRLTLTNLSRQRTAAYKQLREQERSAQLHRFLDAQYISSAQIKGITPALKSALASFGIETAADVSAVAVFDVPGFGKVRTQRMVDWRNHVAKRFRFQPGRDVDPIEQKRIEGRYASGALRIARDFATAQTELERRISELKSRVGPAKQAADDAVRALAQARADRQALTDWH